MALLEFRGIQLRNSAPKPTDKLENSEGGKEEVQRSQTSKFSSQPAKSLGLFYGASLRQSFLIERSCLLLVIYLVSTVWWHLLTPYGPIKQSDLASLQQTYLRRLSDVSLRETVIRACLVVHFLWGSWALVTAYHTVLALIFVGLKLDEPEEWPPVYGSLSQAYPLRGFWGKFWNRLTYRTFAFYAAALLERGFGLPRGATLHRIMFQYLIFLGSGVYMQ